MFKIIFNKVILFIFFRYVAYIVQFANSLIIASILGPAYLGVWGVISLALQYLAQINLGIPYSSNVMLSIHRTEKRGEKENEQTFNSAIFIICCLSTFLLLIYGGIKLSNINLSFKYNLTDYLPYIFLITIITHFNNIFNNLYRVYNKLQPIIFAQTIIPIATLIFLMLLKEKTDIFTLLNIMIAGGLLSLFVFIILSPLKVKVYINKAEIKILLFKGLFLFIYNASFYLIMLSTRGLVSSYYKVEEFGYFTFAFTIGSAALLFLDSFSFLIYPKLINRLNNSVSDKAIQILETIRKDYILVSHLILHCLILVFPFIVSFFPAYQASIVVFNFIALTFMLQVNNFGYSSLLIARNKEKKLALATLFTLVLNILIVYCLIYIVNVGYQYALIGTMAAYYIYNAILLSKSIKELKVKISKIDFISKIMSIGILIPLTISALLSILNLPVYYYCIPIILLVILNFKSFIYVVKTIITIIKNPNIINL